MYSKEELLEKIKPVIDPEVGFSVVDMGLIYNATMDEEGKVNIDMTLTTPNCPLGPFMGKQVEQTLLQDEDIKEVNINWVFSPKWDPETMASDEVKWTMGIF